MADAGMVFDDPHLTIEDDRRVHGEIRSLTIGFLSNRMVIVAWKSRKDATRIISMRKANEREQVSYGRSFD